VKRGSTARDPDPRDEQAQKSPRFARAQTDLISKGLCLFGSLPGLGGGFFPLEIGDAATFFLNFV